jgi:RimJ/RimL family protein N-acetyltransferase
LKGKQLKNINLRFVKESDLPIFYLQQADEEAARMADFPIRTEEAFYAHWQKIMADPANILRTIEWEGQVSGNIVSFLLEGKREVGYWLGREYWGKGIATRALELFLQEVTERPLYGFTAHTNPASARVLEKNGFKLKENTEKGKLFILRGKQ